MGYRPHDHLLWDFWTVRQGGTTHLFYLRAPRDLPDPELRHGQARVGHAVSRDLARWHDRGLALQPGPPGAWDDRAIWTGSVIALPPDHGGGFAMLYTGSGTPEDGKVQRIGLATSQDLDTWTKHPANPLIEADPRWYVERNPDHHGETAWRDPWLMPDPDGPGFLALITAQARAADPHGCGCVALAGSQDLVHWTVEPPIACPGWVFHMEIPQAWLQDGRCYLLFSADRKWIAPSAPLAPQSGTFYLAADGLLGDYAFGGVLAGDDGRYGVKLLNGGDGHASALAWLGYRSDGSFQGALSDPMTVQLTADGQLMLR